MRLALAIALVFCCTAPVLAAAPATPPASVRALGATPAKQAAALYEFDWQWRLRAYPELATEVGDKRYNDRLSDMSLEASLAANRHDADMLRLAREIDGGRLRGQDLISWQLFVYEKENAVARAALYPYVVQPISQQDGVHIEFPRLVAQTPFATAKDYRDYLARLHALPRHIDGVIAQLEAGIASGWVAPAATQRIVPDQIRQLREKLHDSPLAAPFAAIPKTIPAGERKALAAAGRAALDKDAGPAFEKLERFIRTRYAPAARQSIAATALPAGAAYYAHAVRTYTTVDMPPAEIHALGQREVARIKNAMQGVMTQTGFKGTFAEFVAFLNKDPRFFYTSEKDLLDGYRAILGRAYKQLPKQFAALAKSPVGVKQVPPLGAEELGSAWYEAGTPDGSRPGYFFANASKLETRPKWGMETLTLHETVPGHHLQIARAQELAGVPAFRRFGRYVAFTEGWALYSESLGEEMGFYTDPYSMFGHLNDELLRAARLAVDTGIHALGWTREQAIAYMDENTANPHSDNIVEVDRYIGWPGQALGYKIGQLKIKALRERAQAELGPRFDVRGFHNAVIDNGPLPLAVLERQIDEWIARRRNP